MWRSGVKELDALAWVLRIGKLMFRGSSSKRVSVKHERLSWRMGGRAVFEAAAAGCVAAMIVRGGDRCSRFWEVCKRS
eukprot:3942124-Prymnesium_polylepis.1